MLDINFFDGLRIGLATPEDIRSWSFGEVKKPETINYRTLKPEKDGLFCEKIFGPTRDWECYCGKYKRVRFKGIICERCGVEVTRAKVRRERMGHIELAAPVTHIWYFKGVPSRLGYLLDLAPKDLEKVIYFAAYMVTDVDVDKRHEDLPRLEGDIEVEKKRWAKRRDDGINERIKKHEQDLAELEAEDAKADIKRKVKEGAERDVKRIRAEADAEIDRLTRVFERFRNLKVQDLEGDEMLYREMRDRFGAYFSGSMGAQAIKRRLETFDLVGNAELLREVARTGKGAKKTRALKRLKVINAFIHTSGSQRGMVLDAVPVIPPDLRPMVQLDGGRFATSDLNDLYRRVINRNNRLKRLIDLGAPEIIVNNEKRMLQEAVDALFDNGRRGRPVTGPGNRAFKSLSDMLKGKQGRFRHNLLGKRVDYSGRSVIVVGPQLKLHQCGLPKQMALELFKPFVMKRLVDLNHAQNIKSAKRMVERSRSVVWDVLEEVIAEHPVMLNRAPTLHRLGIQAFEPLLIEGKAIQIHPLVTTAFNADFDGDQMAVHLPLSAEAQAEARILMLSSNNILSPANGKPITTPTQDMVLGIYFLTGSYEGELGEGGAYSSVDEAMMAFDRKVLSIRAKIKLRVAADVVPPKGANLVNYTPGKTYTLETTLGRALFNDALPVDFEFVNKEVDKKVLGSIVNELADRYERIDVATALDKLKDLGFYWATRSGVTVSFDDIVAPAEKAKLLAAAEDKAAKVEKNYERGLVSDTERRQELIEIWTKATEDIARAMDANFHETNPLRKMVASGARGNMLQLRQLAGMRGLVSNPKGEIIPRPIKSNFREGLSVLEYFISTHGARKGLADTALRTADSGYLTRRLVDVSQDVIIREEDCGTDRGMPKEIATKNSAGKLTILDNVESSVASRYLAQDVQVDGKVVAAANTELTMPVIEALVESGVSEVRARTVFTCESKVGTCATCYGRSLAAGKLVDVGEAVGIIAAQSIGEPGTQLTMRTFHTGGVAGDDITQGLPRVVELFEARTPKAVAPIAPFAGTVKIEEADRIRKITILGPDEQEETFSVPKRQRLLVEDGAQVEVGKPLVVGPLDPKQILDVLGIRAVQAHLVEQVQLVYRSQGVSIHDKHIEIICRQMLKRVTILDSGETTLLAGELIDRASFEEANRSAVAEGVQPAQGRPVMLGITKASLATDSWLSAASFQETTRVLTEAAIQGKSDPLLGLKENVILGKLIPAGTGLGRYRNVKVEPTEEAKSSMYASLSTYDDLPYFGFTETQSEAIPLEEYDFGGYDQR